VSLQTAAPGSRPDAPTIPASEISARIAVADLAAKLGVSEAELQSAENLAALGIDSVKLVEARQRLVELTGEDVPLGEVGACLGIRQPLAGSSLQLSPLLHSTVLARL
jgi:aryl carrier-like protein